MVLLEIYNLSEKLNPNLAGGLAHYLLTTAYCP
jgi:hypothetical protein